MPSAGYCARDVGPDGEGTRLTICNELEGHGPGKLLAPVALRAARKDADAFVQRIKRAVESVLIAAR